MILPHLAAVPTGGGLAAAYCYPSYIHADVGNVVGGMHCRHPFEIRRPESAVVPGERFSSSRLFGCERGSILSDSLTSAVSRFPFFFRFVLACIPTKTCDNQGFECDSIHTRTSFLFLVEVRQISAKKRRLSLAYRPTISANVAVSVGVLDMFTFVFVCHQA